MIFSYFFWVINYIKNKKTKLIDMYNEKVFEKLTWKIILNTDY